MAYEGLIGLLAARRAGGRVIRAVAALMVAAGLSACGGGGGAVEAPSAVPLAAPDASASAVTLAAAATEAGAGAAPGTAANAATDGIATPAVSRSAFPTSRALAQRFLNQATFGATDAQVDRLMAVGYDAWITEQFALPAHSHRADVEAADAAAKALDPTRSATQDDVIASFWKQAVTGDDQLRQRVAYALSQIFVISMQDSTVGNNPRAVADWLDMLGDKGLGSHRVLLEAVSRHPMMGTYLTSIKNQKANASTGRVPDENYAREVMQLFTIGLAQLNLDGTPKLDGAGQPIDTYGQADIGGLARVFTGFSWDCPDFPANGCFYNGMVTGGTSNPDRTFLPMRGYPQFHSTEEKRFLGTVIAAQATAQPDDSLRAALDTLSGHPNVGPFLARQLIQRLVTSNPSPAYVAWVVSAFNGGRAGPRGDLKATIRAVLTYPEARQVTTTSGKLREPVLRLAAFLRAFPQRSDSGAFKVGNTDNPGSSLGQTPLRAPSVFNFYRPGYVAPGTLSAGAGLVAPELQLANETTAAGYVNAMRDYISQGVGSYSGTFSRRDIQADYSAELALADQPAALVARVDDRLLAGTMGAALRTEVEGAVQSITIPVRNASGSNQSQIDAAKRNRVNAALLLGVASPEFQVQR